MEQRTVGSKSALGVLAGIFLAVLSACGGASTGGDIVKAPGNLTSVSVSPSNPTVVVGDTKQFKATAGHSDGSTTDVTSTATWVSSDPNQASISSNGLATGINPGAPNIQATFGGLTGLTILNVATTAAQNGLTLGQLFPSIAPGASLQLIAVGHYVDDSTQTVTGLATWSSNSPAVVTVETSTDANPGLVKGIAAGTAIITANVGGFPASTTVTVLPNAALIPLMDMTASQNYLGFQGGLYEGSKNIVPADHDTAGKAAAAAIQPLNQSGSASANGAVVFLSIGFSNATIEFSRFVTNASTDAKVNHSNLAIEDGAHGAVTACSWTVAISPPFPETVCGVPSGSVQAENQYDRIRDSVLATAVGAPGSPQGCGTPASPCLTEAQVQVIWMKNGNPDPGTNGFRAMSPSTNCASELPKPTTESCLYEQQMGEIVRAAKIRYPNLKQIFFTTRIYAGYASSPLNPEPYAYEYGFSGKWLVQAQIDQIRNSTVDPVAGDLNYRSGGPTAWIAWATYPWANGTNARSDGLIWCNGQAGSPCNGEVDFQLDGTHPSSDDPGHDGTTKVANGLMTFFKSSPYTASWFCQTAQPCGP